MTNYFSFRHPVKSDRPSKSYLDETSMPDFLLPGSSEDNHSPTSPSRATIEGLEEEDEEEEEGEGEEREGRSSSRSEEEEGELQRGGVRF